MSHNNFGSSESILMKLFPVDKPQVRVITRVQFSEGPSLKICESEKNVQNSAQCLTTFDFDREYFRKGRLKKQVRKTQVQICRGGKRKYGNGKSDLNADVTEKYHCQSTE